MKGRKMLTIKNVVMKIIAHMIERHIDGRSGMGRRVLPVQCCRQTHHTFTG